VKINVYVFVSQLPAKGIIFLPQALKKLLEEQKGEKRRTARKTCIQHGLCGIGKLSLFHICTFWSDCTNKSVWHHTNNVIIINEPWLSCIWHM